MKFVTKLVVGGRIIRVAGNHRPEEIRAEIGAALIAAKTHWAETYTKVDPGTGQERYLTDADWPAN